MTTSSKIKTVGVLWVAGKHYRLKKVPPMSGCSKASDVSISTSLQFPRTDRPSTIAMVGIDNNVEVVVNGVTLWNGPADITGINGRYYPDVQHMVIKPKPSNTITITITTLQPLSAEA